MTPSCPCASPGRGRLRETAVSRRRDVDPGWVQVGALALVVQDRDDLRQPAAGGTARRGRPAVRRLGAGTTRRRIPDLGAGIGTGTTALAQRFGSARVTALDVSEQMLTRVRAKALDLGLAERVRTLRAHLGPGLARDRGSRPRLGLDGLHELADPEGLLHR